jgi:tetratricopeptide (TPR) repeat protein
MTQDDAKLKEAISFFEQMLQTIPDDRTSLEFLAVAYKKSGEADKRLPVLLRLSEALLKDKDYDKASQIAEALSSYPDDPAARRAVTRIAEVVQSQLLKTQFHREIQEGIAGAPIPGIPVPAALGDSALDVQAFSRSAAATEMDLVWLWKERGWLAPEKCTEALRVLTERPVSDVPVLISALAWVFQTHPEDTDKLMASMQEASNLPFIPLERLECSREASALLPSAFVQIKGVMPFAVMAGEALVALLNPLSQPLQDEIRERAKCPCHFYFSHPKAWQELAQKVI